MTNTLWTDPAFRVKRVAKAADINAWVRDNLDWLHHPDSGVHFIQHPGTGGNYTTTGTNGAELDSSTFRLTINSYGGLMLVGAVLTMDGSAASTAVRADIALLDSTTFLGKNMFSNTSVEVSGVSIRSVGILRPFVLPAGEHTFTIVWAVGSGTGTVYVAYKPYMFAFER